MPRSVQAQSGTGSNVRQDGSWHWQEKGWHEEATESWYEQEQALVCRKRVARERSHDRSDASKNPKPAAPKDSSPWMLKAQEYSVDGNWYVELAGNTWKLVTGPWYCRLCDMELDDEQDHAWSEMHRIKLALEEAASPAQQPSVSPLWPARPKAAVQLPPAPVPSAMPTCRRAASPHQPAPLSHVSAPPSQEAALSQQYCGAAQLRDWEELMPDGFRRCKACDKYLDGRHEEQVGHKERLNCWMQYRITQMAGFPAPQESWLAWVPDDNRSGDRHLKCLLCQKWTDARYPASHSRSQPARATSWHHSGSPHAPAGSKDHQTKLRSYELGPIKEEHLRYHPEAAGTPAAAQAGTASTLLPPWKAALDPEGRTYYYNYRTLEACWKKPTMNMLPAGWEVATDSERNLPYYYHVATGKSQWQHPAEPEVVD